MHDRKTKKTSNPSLRPTNPFIRLPLQLVFISIIYYYTATPTRL